MKEIKLLESWADDITEFKQPTRMGTPMTAKADRPLPRNIDIQYKAQRAHPELSPEQALALYMNDELVDKEKMDFAQNKLINTVKRENEKLRKNVTDIGNELHDLERQEAETDKEVARLRDLSAKLRPAGEVQQMAAKASADKVQNMLSDLEKLQNKPGVDDAKYQELVDKVNRIKSGPVDNTDVQKVQAALAALGQRQNVDDELFNKVMGRLETTEKELAAKEKRFQKSITKNAEKIGQWGNKFGDLDDKVKKIEVRAKEVLDNVEKENDNLQDKFNRLADLIYKINPDILQQAGITAGSVASSVADRQEKDEADLAKIQPEPVDPEEIAAAKLQAASGSSQVDIDDTLDDEPFDKDKVVSIFKNQGKQSSTMPDDMKDAMKQEPRKVNEQDLPITMVDKPETNQKVTPDYIEDTVIPNLVRWYRNQYPIDLKQYTVQQLMEIIRRTVTGGLLIYGDDITDKTVEEYLARVRGWLRKSRPVAPELPGIPSEPPSQGGLQESMFRNFTDELDRLTGGY
jgi:hypothetical protein